MLAVVIPIHRAEFWPAIRACYERQDYADKGLVVIANGCDLDTSMLGQNTYVEFHQHKLGPGTPRNAGLRGVRALQADRFAFFDADDRYLPQYLSEQAHHLQSYRVVGKGSYPVHDHRNDDLWLAGEGLADKEVDFATGGTLAGYTADALDFVERFKTGEDYCWCDDMRGAGFKIRSTSRDNYVKTYLGDGVHTHPIPLDQVKGRMRLLGKYNSAA